MTYREMDATGTQTNAGIQSLAIIRKLTGSQGARSSYYDVPVTTGKPSSAQVAPRWPRSAPQPTSSTDHELTISRREHVGRLLRECVKASSDLLNSQDPQGATLSGVKLLNLLQELWSVREAREQNWREIINLLQILLTHEEFETLSSHKRAALHNLLGSGVLVRTVGLPDLNHVVSSLRGAGFDLWLGIGG